MNNKMLENHMNDENFISAQEKQYLRYYDEARKEKPVVGEHHGRKYITLSMKSTLDREFCVKICNQKEMCLYHIHDWIELSYVYRGTCHMEVLDQQIDLHEGEFILLNTGVPHAEGRIGPDGIFLNLMFDKRYFDQHFFSALTQESIVTGFFVDAMNKEKDHANYIVFHSGEDERIPILIRMLLCEYYDPSICSQDSMRSLITLILCELVRCYQKNATDGSGRAGNAQIAQILRYIENHADTCTLRDTAKFFCMSPNYMTVQLKKAVGRSFKQLVQESRLQRAARLLRDTDASVRSIANTVGYENIGFFNTKFHDTYGMMPGEYRSRHTEALTSS